MNRLVFEERDISTLVGRIYNGVTQRRNKNAMQCDAYLFVELNPCRLKLLNDFSSAEGVGVLSLRQAFVLLGLAEGLSCRGTAREGVQGNGHVLGISYLF